MNKKFVEIDDATLLNLEKIAKESGFTSIEELLTAFAKNFSTGCSVTLAVRDHLAREAVAQNRMVGVVTPKRTSARKDERR